MKTEVTVLKPMILAGTVYQAGDKIDVVKDQTWEETWFTPKGIIDAIDQGYIEKVADGEYKVLPGKVITYSAYTYKEGETFHAPDIYDEAWTPVQDKPWIKALVAQGVIKAEELPVDPVDPVDPVEPPGPEAQSASEKMEPTDIKMTPATKSATPATSFTVTATVLPEGAEGTPVISVDDGLELMEDGQIFIPEDTAPGVYNVTATLGSITGVTKVTVKATK